MNTVALTILSSGLVTWLVCLPLIKRRVPMNRSYGFRFSKAFESERQWYDINAYGGRKLAAWSWLITASGVAGLFLPAKHLTVYACVSLVISIVAVAVPIIDTIRWSWRRNT